MLEAEMGFFRRVSGHALRNKISHLGWTWGRVAAPRWKEPGYLSRHTLGKVFQTCPVTTTYWLVSKYLRGSPRQWRSNKYDVTRRNFHLNYWCIKHLWRLHILNIPHPIDVLQFYGKMNPAQKQRKSRVKRTGIKSLADSAHITENSRTYGSGEQLL